MVPARRLKVPKMTNWSCFVKCEGTQMNNIGGTYESESSERVNWNWLSIYKTMMTWTKLCKIATP